MLCTEIIVLRFVYPGEAVIVVFVLAIVPYLILRGLVNRLHADGPHTIRVTVHFLPTFTQVGSGQSPGDTAITC